MVGSSPSRFPEWNTIKEPSGKTCSESTQSKQLYWWAQGTLGFFLAGKPAVMRRTGTSSLSCKWVRQFSLRRDITWINEWKNWACGAQWKGVCLMCTKPLASHPAPKYFRKRSLIFKFLPSHFYLFSTTYWILSENEKDKDCHPVPRFASTRKWEMFFFTEFLYWLLI